MVVTTRKADFFVPMLRRISDEKVGDVTFQVIEIVLATKTVTEKGESR